MNRTPRFPFCAFTRSPLVADLVFELGSACSRSSFGHRGKNSHHRQAEQPPGSDRQLARGESLTQEVQKAVQSLPLACADQLPALPGNLDRVVYSGRVMLIDSNNKILDIFYLDDSQ